MPNESSPINPDDQKETFRFISKSYSELKIKGEHIENSSKQDSNENVEVKYIKKYRKK